MDSSAVQLGEATAITSDAGAALPSPCAALQQRSMQQRRMPDTDEHPATTAFALEALPPDLTLRIFETLAALTCPECPGTPPRLRALQPAALVCVAWRAAARQLVRQLKFKGGRDGAWDARDLSVFPQLSRLVFKKYVRDEDAAQLLRALPAPDDPALSAAASAVSGSSSQAQNDRPDVVPGGKQQRASVAGGGCFSGRCGGLRDISGGTSIQVGSALQAYALHPPLPAALTSLTRLDVSLKAPRLRDPCASGRHSCRSGVACCCLAAALDALPRLVHLNLRDSPPVCAALAAALPRAARLRALVVEPGLTPNLSLKAGEGSGIWPSS
jgi:hypothetical protein